MELGILRTGYASLVHPHTPDHIPQLDRSCGTWLTPVYPKCPQKSVLPSEKRRSVCTTKRGARRALSILLRKNVQGVRKTQTLPVPISVNGVQNMLSGNVPRNLPGGSWLALRIQNLYVPERHRNANKRGYLQEKPPGLLRSVGKNVTRPALLSKLCKNHQEHAARIRVVQAAWKARNPDKVSAQNKVHKARRRALKAACPLDDFTPVQWRALCKAVGYRCCYCGEKFPSTKLTPDHLTPYVKQGSNTLHNILPCCVTCNSRKKDHSVLKPVQPFLLLSDEAAAD